MRSDSDLLAIRNSVDRLGRLSDGLFRVGPWSVGLDGVLSWIPGVGEIYSAGAAAFLIGQGLRAKVPAGTLAVAAALMGGRTIITAVPFAGPLVSDALTMHKWSAKLIVAAIDKKLAEARPAGRSSTVQPMAALPA